MRTLPLVLVLLAGCAGPGTSPSRVTHYALVVGGHHYTPQQADWYWGSASWMYRVLRDKYGYRDENIYLLHAQNRDPAIVDGRATRDNVRAVLRHLAAIARAGDRLFVYMVGHTGAENGHSHYLTVGPTLSDTELAEDLDRLADVEVTLAMSPCQTEGFLWRCSGAGRVIVVSTRLDEVNSAGVAEAFIRGLEEARWDLDGDGRNSIFEAYQSVVEEQRTWWAAHGQPQVEHALLDDNGDGKGNHLPEGDGGDGALARRRFLGDGGRQLTITPAALQALTEANRALVLER